MLPPEEPIIAVWRNDMADMLEPLVVVKTMDEADEETSIPQTAEPAGPPPVPWFKFRFGCDRSGSYQTIPTLTPTIAPGPSESK